MEKDTERVVKVAVIGSGLAGLTAAFLLSSAKTCDNLRFDVHIFEKVSLKVRWSPLILTCLLF